MKQYRLVQVLSEEAEKVATFCDKHGIAYSTRVPMSDTDATLLKLNFPEITIWDFDIPYSRSEGNSYE
jgi:hypothetical protein